MDRSSNAPRESRPRDNRSGREADPRPRDPDGRGGAKPADARRPSEPRRTPVPAVEIAAAKAGVPHGATENGWLPDYVYTGEKFEAGLAFFADALGRITRFSREPADLAAARRLEGQAALPGMVNAHAHTFARVFRGRGDLSFSEVPAGPFSAVMSRLSGEEVFDAARMAFLEMLLAGITCVGEFHLLHAGPDGNPLAEPNSIAREVVRAAHDVGIRIALLNVAWLRGGFRGEGTVPPRFRTESVEAFLRDTERLRVMLEKEFPADEAWLGVGGFSIATVPLEAMKAIATYARAHRLRFHVRVAHSPEENANCAGEYGRAPVALLAEQGIIDKRFTAVGAGHLSDDEIRQLGAARAMIAVCPAADLTSGFAVAPVDRLLAAGAGVALGTGASQTTDLLKDARLLELHLRAVRRQATGLAADPVPALFHAATVTGARSLGATTGALEVGRPADFFTVGLYDPSLAGCDQDSLLATVLFALERRAIRDVWIGARQRIANGRHVAHGQIVGRFVDAQRRLWVK